MTEQSINKTTQLDGAVRPEKALTELSSSPFDAVFASTATPLNASDCIWLNKATFLLTGVFLVAASCKRFATESESCVLTLY
jgi:hypothetical protein